MFGAKTYGRYMYEQVKGTTDVTGFRQSLAIYTRITNSTVISLMKHPNFMEKLQ